MYKENRPDTAYMTVHRCNIMLHLRKNLNFGDISIISEIPMLSCSKNMVLGDKWMDDSEISWMVKTSSTTGAK